MSADNATQDAFRFRHNGRHGAPVIFLHGIGGQARNFDPLIEGIDTKSCFALNLPGYDNAAYQDGDFTFEALSHRLADFIDQKCDGKAHLVGHSIGGMIAIEHAIRFPQQVQTLAVMGATAAFGGRDDSFKQAFLKARLAPLDAGNTMAEIAAKTAPYLVAPHTDTKIIAMVEASLAAVPEAIWRAILVCLTQFNRRDDIAQIAIPALVIAGAHDDNAPAKTLAKMADQLPQGLFHLVEHAGHILPLEASAEIRQILLDFWSSKSV